MMEVQTFPWRSKVLADWSIVGMNHYHIGGEKHLFVALTKGDRCIQAEGPDNPTIWDALERLAASEIRDNAILRDSGTLPSDCDQTNVSTVCADTGVTGTIGKEDTAKKKPGAGPGKDSG